MGRTVGADVAWRKMQFHKRSVNFLRSCCNTASQITEGARMEIIEAREVEVEVAEKQKGRQR